MPKLAAVFVLALVAPAVHAAEVVVLPDALQKVTVNSGVVMNGAAHPAEARALLDYLASAEGQRAFLQRGFTRR